LHTPIPDVEAMDYELALEYWEEAQRIIQAVYGQRG
jgi:hypothetical protein